jgi:predicted TIM-barrel fold metal-dependent hydrolase
MLPTDDIERDVAELERCARMGLRGAMIAVTLGAGESYSDPKFERLWAAAADLGMPLSLHVGASEEGFFYTNNKFTDFSLAYTPVMYTIVNMIFEGILDRHPKLQIMSVENDAAWAVGCLERMDNRWRLDRKWAGNHGLVSGRQPSEIFHDQVGINFMFDRNAILCRDIIGKTNIMYGDDYPHHDGTWPLTRETLERQLEGVPLEDQIRIGRTNTIDFYKLPIETRLPELEIA